MSFEGDLLELAPRLRRFAASLSRNRVDGDDLCQAALERALRSHDQWQSGTRLDSWMYRIMRNIWIDEDPSRQRSGPSFAPDDAGGRQIEDAMALSDLNRALNTLPDEQREAIALVLIEGFSYTDTAEILSVPMGTLTSRLVRGRGALIAMIGEAA